MWNALEVLKGCANIWCDHFYWPRYVHVRWHGHQQGRDLSSVALAYFFLFIYFTGFLFPVSRFASLFLWSVRDSFQRDEVNLNGDKLIITSYKTYLLLRNACTLSIKQVWKGKWGHFVLLIHLSICLPVPHCLDYGSFILILEVEWC